VRREKAAWLDGIGVPALLLKENLKALITSGGPGPDTTTPVVEDQSELARE
jgi:hypothetical protein